MILAKFFFTREFYLRCRSTTSHVIYCGLQGVNRAAEVGNLGSEIENRVLNGYLSCPKVHTIDKGAFIPRWSHHEAITDL